MPTTAAAARPARACRCSGPPALRRLRLAAAPRADRSAPGSPPARRSRSARRSACCRQVPARPADRRRRPGCAPTRCSAFMLLVIGAVAPARAAASPAWLHAEIAAWRASPRTRVPALRHPAAALPRRDGHRRPRRQPRPGLGRDRGHHDRHRVPRRPPPHRAPPWRPPGNTSVICSAGIAIAFLGLVLLYFAARHAGLPAGAWTGPPSRRRARTSTRPSPASPSACCDRLRRQSRPRPPARLAARRPLPGPRPDLRADVRGPAVGRVLHDPADQGHRRPRPRHRLHPHPAAHPRPGHPRSWPRHAGRPAGLQADARLLQHGTHGPDRPRRRRRHPAGHRRAAAAHRRTRPGQGRRCSCPPGTSCSCTTPPASTPSVPWPPAHRCWPASSASRCSPCSASRRSRLFASELGIARAGIAAGLGWVIAATPSP